MYASWNGSNWNLQEVAQGVTCLDLALDSNNNPYLLFYDSHMGSGIGYASWTGANWTIQTVDSSAGFGGSLALDSTGNPHIAYIGNNEQMKYASWTSSGWSFQALEATGGFNVMSLVLDSNNNPHLMYDVGTMTSDQTLSFMRYAVWDNDTNMWNYQTVLANATIGQLALDSNGFPHFTSFEDQPGHRTLSYGSWNGSDWNIQAVASNINSTARGGYFALDSHGYPHITYFIPTSSDYLTGDLLYSRWTGNSWDTQTVDSNASGPGTLALDSNGKEHIAYLGNITYISSTGIFSYLMYANAEPTHISDAMPIPAHSSIAIPMVGLDLLVAAPVITAAILISLVYVRRKKNKKVRELGNRLNA